MDLSYGAPLPLTELKAVGDAWEVSGYASTYGNVDLGGDVVLRGAFDDWLKGWRAGTNKTRFLFSHVPSQILGKPTEMRSDDRGLFVKARISKTQLGADVHTLLKDEALDSFSIGYIPTEMDFDESGIRKLIKADLPEFSLVAMPMNEEAEVTGVKRRGLPGLKTAVPFDELVAQLLGHLSIGVDEAEALHARRITDKRRLSDDHLEAIQSLQEKLTGFAGRLEALLADPPPEPAKAGGALRLRLETARHRLRLAGVEV